MTHRPFRERALSQILQLVDHHDRLESNAGPISYEGMTAKMVEAIRGAVSSSRSSVKFADTYYENERAILNDACGWSDEPIRVVMQKGSMVEVTPETTWFLRGGG